MRWLFVHFWYRSEICHCRRTPPHVYHRIWKAVDGPSLLRNVKNSVLKNFEAIRYSCRPVACSVSLPSRSSQKISVVKQEISTTSLRTVIYQVGQHPQYCPSPLWRSHVKIGSEGPIRFSTLMSSVLYLQIVFMCTNDFHDKTMVSSLKNRLLTDYSL